MIQTIQWLKFLLLIVFGTINFQLLGQARLGSKASDIRKEFSDPKYNLKSEYKDGTLFIQIDIEELDVKALFLCGTNEICKATAIFPNNQKALNDLVELYNKAFVVISKTEWRMYTKNGIANVKLYFVDDGYYFLWTVDE